MTRTDGRRPDELRPTTLERGVAPYAEGSCLIAMGNTRVLATASVEEKAPPFLKGTGGGWVTAEYAMLPRSCRQRIQRDSARGHVNGRAQEIQRLIGRSLRSVVDLPSLGERTITIDCDVLQGDGGTRTAAITAAYVALAQATQWMLGERLLQQSPITQAVAAVSVGAVQREELLDLCYEEDSAAAVDMNLVMTEHGEFVEVQGTAEGAPFNMERLTRLIELGRRGVNELIAMQKSALTDLS